MRSFDKSVAAILFSLSVILAAPVAARDFHSVAELDQRAADFLNAGIGEPGGARTTIDRRLKLSRCPQPVDFEKRSPALLVIRCEVKGWRVSVSLMDRLSFRGKSYGQRFSIARGQPVLLVAGKSGFTISRQMIAVRSGKLGDFIPVRANRKAQPIMAKIIGPGRVTIMDMDQR